MKSKTVIAFAVASAFAWPLASGAHDSVRTPRSVNESSDVQVQHDRFTREHVGVIGNDDSFEVATPLSVNETGPAANWSGFDQWANPGRDRIAMSEEIGSAPAMTAPADNETASSTEGGLTMNDLSMSRSEGLAAADQGTYNGYLVEVPAQTDYYIVEPSSSDQSTAYIVEPPSASYDVVVVPESQ